MIGAFTACRETTAELLHNSAEVLRDEFVFQSREGKGSVTDLQIWREARGSPRK